MKQHLLVVDATDRAGFTSHGAEAEDGGNIYHFQHICIQNVLENVSVENRKCNIAAFNSLKKRVRSFCLQSNWNG